MSLYYVDSCVLLKLVQREPQTDALRTWRSSLDRDASLITSQLAGVEVARTFRRVGLDRQRIPFMVVNALKGIDQVVLDDEVLTRAAAFEVQKLGTLDAIHLATAQPLAAELDGFLTYDRELTAAAKEIGLPHFAPA